MPLIEGGKHLDLPAMGYQPLHLATRRKALKELAFTAIAFELSQRPPGAETVGQWFERASNSGIICGAAGLLVLDFDDGPAFERWRGQNEDLVAATPRQHTPNGVHVFLRCETPIVSSSLHHGLRRVGHVKALGGYIAAAPSRMSDGGCYRWASGQSLFEREPQPVASLESLGLHAVSPFKRGYDRLLGRGFFESR